MLKRRSYPVAALMLCKGFLPCEVLEAHFLLGCQLIIFDCMCCPFCHCLPALSGVTQGKWFKGICVMLDSEYKILVYSEWRIEDWVCCMYIVHHKNKAGNTTYCALHMSFNTAFTLLLSFTVLNLVFRSFDHEKRS